MRKSLFALLITVAWTISATAQINISTDLRQDAIWDMTNEEWSVFSSDDEQLTFFVIDEDFTMFTHITPNLESAYLIRSQEYDEVNNQYSFDVVSDVGNEYLMVLDVIDENIRILYESGEETLLIQHEIKRIWVD